MRPKSREETPNEGERNIGMLESSVEDYTVALAKRNGFIARKLKWIGRRNAPDHFFSHAECGPILVEFKRPKNPADRTTQDREIARLRAAGVRVEKIYTMEAGRALFGH